MAVTLTYKFDKHEHYLLACSYGPDSMCLFDLMCKAKVNFTVCHVNYHKRDISNFEQESLEKICKERNIPFEALDTEGMTIEGNFQEWAREVRYKFFQKMYIKYGCAGLCIAHQQDDSIETYIMQQKRMNLVKEYGLVEVSYMREMRIIRPLLKYTKKELQDYNNENNVPYSIDVSNFEDVYLRNKIRREIVNPMSPQERQRIVDEMDNANRENAEFITNLYKKINIEDELPIRTIMALDKREFQEVIIRFVDTLDDHIDISSGLIDEIRKMCLSQKPNISILIGDNTYIVKEYDVLILLKMTGIKPYAYRIPAPGKYSYPEFEIDFSMGAEDRKIFPESYPLIIRNGFEDDTTLVGGHICSVHRLYIDWKMPFRLRKVWPVVEDKNGKIIYIPRYRKSFVDQHKSKFIIKVNQ